MKKYLFGIAISIFVLFPFNIKALSCTNEQKVKYQEMAKNISANYDYVEANDDITFNIKISNIPEGFIIVDVNNDKSYNYSGSEITINNVERNKSYRFAIMKDGVPCSWTIFYSHYVSIPSYNKYYKDEICKGVEDYKLCSKWLQVNMTYDEWKKQVSNYKENIKIEENNENKNNIEGIFDIILNFYLDYYMYILPTIIVLCLFGVYRYNKKNDLF